MTTEPIKVSHLAVALWEEFGWGSPDDTQNRPRRLDADDPYWTVAAARLIDRLGDPALDRAVPRIPQLAGALRGIEGSVT